MIEPGQYLTPDQVAEQMQVSRVTVMRWLRAGKIKGVKLGKLWRVPVRAVWVAELVKAYDRYVAYTVGMLLSQAARESGRAQDGNWPVVVRVAEDIESYLMAIGFVRE